MVPAGVVKLVPLRTHLMVVDALTKSLPSPAHISNIKHREIMLGHVPFSFAARTLRRTVGGGVYPSPPSLSLSIFLSLPMAIYGGASLFSIVVCKGESDYGSLPGGITAHLTGPLD
jgi:hypothetical protein